MTWRRLTHAFLRAVGLRSERLCPNCGDPATGDHGFYCSSWCAEFIGEHGDPANWGASDASAQAERLRRRRFHKRQVDLMAHEDPRAFLCAVTLGREAFVDYLAARGVAVQRFPDDHPERPGAIEFQSDDETWLAEFYPKGHFKQLVWS